MLGLQSENVVQPWSSKRECNPTLVFQARMQSNLLRFLRICPCPQWAPWSKCVATSGRSSSTLGNNLTGELVYNLAMSRFWRRILMHTVEWEPGLRDFLPDFSSLDRQVSFNSTPFIVGSSYMHLVPISIMYNCK